MIRLHNTLSGELEDFKPIDSKKVRMFVCGPTVYDFAHLGNFKTYTQFDIIARTLRYLGYDLEYLENITDIDDKIIKRAHEQGISPDELAQKFEAYYLEDMQSLNNTSVSTYARAHEYIPQIVDQVQKLIEKGFAYKISDGYYFDINKFEGYGKLSGRSSLQANDAVSRIDENPEKRNTGDFCLWKFRKEGDPYWNTELGEGRPGWHIEDTAITESHFGPQYDIHGGARDLIFPHHEAEIAQMEAASGKEPLVRYWLHTGFLNTDAEKMSKSLGNFKTARDVFAAGLSPLALRYYFLSGHYRSPMSFTEESLEGAESAYRRLKLLVKMFSDKSEGEGTVSDLYKKEFIDALESDFNAPEALAVVWKMTKFAGDDLSYADAYATLLDFDKVLGLNLGEDEYEVKDIPEEVQALLDERQKAREAKDFAKSDELRDKIKALGYMVDDKNSGQELRKM